MYFCSSGQEKKRYLRNKYDIKNTSSKEFILIRLNLKVISNNSDNQMSFESSEEIQREVIVNKTIFRAIRRLYLDIFKIQNNKLVK